MLQRFTRESFVLQELSCGAAAAERFYQNKRHEETCRHQLFLIIRHSHRKEVYQSDMTEASVLTWTGPGNWCSQVWWQEIQSRDD